MNPVAGIKQIDDMHWQMSSDHRESAEKATDILRVMALMNRPPERPAVDENRGTLLDIYG